MTLLSNFQIFNDEDLTLNEIASLMISLTNKRLSSDSEKEVGSSLCNGFAFAEYENMDCIAKQRDFIIDNELTYFENNVTVNDVNNAYNALIDVLNLTTGTEIQVEVFEGIVKSF